MALLLAAPMVSLLGRYAALLRARGRPPPRRDPRLVRHWPGRRRVVLPRLRPAAATAGADRIVIVNKSIADRLFPGQPAVGRTLHWTDSVLKFVGISAFQPRRIVGVVPDYDDTNIIPDAAMTIDQPVDRWCPRS